MTQAARQRVLDSCRQYFDSRPKPEFIPGQTYLPAAGKVLDAEDLVNLVEACLDLWLTAGRFSDQFEAQLSAKTGVKHARLTVSGSAANLLAVSALTSPQLGPRRLEPGSEVLTVAAGFPTTVGPIVQNRCRPVFADVDLETLNADPECLAQGLSPKTRAIVLAHTLGNPFDLQAVLNLAQDRGLYLIEDCCDAFGSLYGGQMVGGFGHLATLSFYPAHHLTTGEGGAVLTDRQDLVRLVESFRDWGRDCWCPTGRDNTCGHRFGWQLGQLPEGYDHKFIYSHLGYNLKMTDIQAAIGLSQLAKVDQFIARRRANFAALSRAFADEGLEEHFILPRATPRAEPSWFGFALTIRDGSPLDRREVVAYLEERRVGTRLLFGGNLTKQPAFAGVDYRLAGPLTNTDKLMRDSFWIGLWPGIGDQERAYIIDIFKKLVKDLVQ
ncbi:MAG: lipopolysaccharide biosynthesis protein RfbH [Deltaproteobacteria bacterium]|nr:lipopolysaccharide biosynthesis protein RfbH [Deltaproteobacteria bacterium]